MTHDLPVTLSLLVAMLAFVPERGFTAESPTIRFDRDVLPILSENCYPCHGPGDQQPKAGLRLDSQANATVDLGGYRAIEIGSPDESRLVQLVESDDPEDRMPPPKTKKQLNAAQRAILRNWIAAGAQYNEHWAWSPPTRPAVPRTAASNQWAENPIDHFIFQRMQSVALSPSPTADRSTLKRRLSLDLTGLPPTFHSVDWFESDPSPDAYAKLVDRLLETPQYGERMAVDWLDAARYADSNGYQVDRDRETYAWRDWVIQAFNENMPYDQFTIEQLAGDLLPAPTLDQLIATGFNRNHMMNEEGGIIPAEFLAEYCADRVETVATVWMGLTFLCARCHDHKYDPLTQTDYYSLFAYFHNVAEQGRGNYGADIRRNNPPMIQLPSPALEAKRDQLREARDILQRKLAALEDEGANTEAIQKELDAAKKEFNKADLAIPTALVMKELSEPRETFVLQRGAYDKPGERVQARTPTILTTQTFEGPQNRLGLAQWLVSRNHPLTARVTVNRLWQSIFGTGLVRTPGDFGTRGALPTHPELLDWLAVEFIESGWNVKGLIRLMVHSATYRQASRIRPEDATIDPKNEYYARSPRYRLQAEFIRDQALAVSGLLIPDLGGPSVRPYHPPGLYEQVVAGRGPSTYVEDQDSGLYRRSLYTYWKRSVPNPAMLTFDAPFRETCVVQRPRTNTAMQALNLMNDPTYVEASRHLALRMMREGGDTPADRIASGFQLVLARPPDTVELHQLTQGLEKRIAEFQAAPEQAKAFLGVGYSPVPEGTPLAELAAYSVTASTLLNLDETLTRE
jgi:hypothetical protein